MQTYHYYHLTPLDAQADRLLRALARDDYPHYTNLTFERKLLRDRSREQWCAHAPAPVEQAAAFLQRRAMAKIISAAQLTRRQAEVVNARADGATWEEIGKRFCQTKQGARKVFCQAVSKIRNAWRMSSLVGIDEVYRAEVRRRGPNRR